MKKPRKVRKVSKHHRLPKSRGGGRKKSNLIILDNSFHEAWHLVFGNLTTAEAHDLIESVMNSGKKSWTSKELHYLRKKIIKEGK